MRHPLAVGLLALVLVGVVSGCHTDPTSPATAVMTDGQALPSQESSDRSGGDNGARYQYRAVCIEKQAHGGNEHVLSKWLDVRNKAQALADYHTEFKDKGHRSRIDTRITPSRNTPRTTL